MSKTKSSSSLKVADWDFPWEQCRRQLDDIFFRGKDFISCGSTEYDDFWLFLKKYLAFRKRRSGEERRPEHKEGVSAILKLPLSYDKRDKLNITLDSDEIRRALDGTVVTRYGREDLRRPLDTERVATFRDIVIHYLDFTQKQKMRKLLKIRNDQQNLPIYKYKQFILDSVRDFQVTVIAGDTGCGKSTQVPQYLLEAGYERIGCTQPRRIAAISLSRRVAFETLHEYGTEVGYQVRFERSRTEHTRIVFVTEGLLLRQLQMDPLLEQYEVLVLDEVHERHIQTDFLLGILRCLLRKRQDLKLVLMSATINIDLFSGYFDDAPVVKVPGRLHPIELFYRPIDKKELLAPGAKTTKLDPAPYIRIMNLIDNKYPTGERGDMLVFLSGLEQITSVVDAAREYALKTGRWIVLPLHSTLSISEQDKVFDVAPEGVRKCVVSTNISETSITIDGMRFVVDSGKVKEMSYDIETRMQRLREFNISRASAQQRRGRAGRTGPGVCFRLYDQKDYETFQEYSTPEIKRVALDSLLLQMYDMGLPDPRRFPFIDPPSNDAIDASIIFLKDQAAITESEKISPIGEMLASLPVDTVIGKMLIMGSIFDLIDPVITTAAALSVQNPFTSQMHASSDQMRSRRGLESEHGDPLTLLNAYDEWVKVKAHNENSKRWCKRKGLEEQRFYEMSKLKKQCHSGACAQP